MPRLGGKNRGQEKVRYKHGWERTGGRRMHAKEKKGITGNDTDDIGREGRLGKKIAREGDRRKEGPYNGRGRKNL